MIKIIFLLLGFICLDIPQVMAKEISIETKSEIKLPGEFLKASMVAYLDFSKKINSYLNEPSQLALHLSDVSNYEINVSKDEKRYLVVFIPKPLQTGHLKGGGAEYVIDKKSFQIIDKTYFK